MSPVEDFIRDGVLAVRGAVPRDLVHRCRDDVYDDLRSRGVDAQNPTTWTCGAVEKMNWPGTQNTLAATVQPAIIAACDLLLGEDRWYQTSITAGQYFVRFPWPLPLYTQPHVDGGWPGEDGKGRINVRAKHRALSVIFLLSDVTENDAPTQVWLGSHRDIARFLAPLRDEGIGHLELSQQIPRSVPDLPSAFLTGNAGDAFILHGLLVHRGTWPHRGTTPRVILNRGVPTYEPFRLDGVDPCPVEHSILDALASEVAT